jgi:hypothetical protein
MNDRQILAECHVDTLLAEIVLPPKKGYNHQHSCTQVLKTIKEKLLNDAALGIIDDDKSAPKDIEVFSLLKKHNDQLSIYKHNDTPHYIIKIGKAIEDFILKNAERCDIELAEYNLPSDLKGLKKITKHVNSLKEAEIKFKKIFSILKQNKNSDLYKLAQWIELFKTNPYHLNVELL